MTMAEKIRNLRTIEGSLRGLGRPMTQEEVSQSHAQAIGEDHQPVVPVAD